MQAAPVITTYVINQHKFTMQKHSSYFSAVLKASFAVLQIKRHATLSSHQAGSPKERIVMFSYSLGELSFSVGTWKLLSMNITWSYLKWMQFDNNEKVPQSCNTSINNFQRNFYARRAMSLQASVWGYYSASSEKQSLQIPQTFNFTLDWAMKANSYPTLWSKMKEHKKEKKAAW